MSDLTEAQRVIATIGPAKTAELLDLLGSVVIQVSDGLEDEGDRVYLGTTNHKDMLRDACQQWFEARYLTLENTTPMGTETPARTSFTGREVLDLLEVVEAKASGPNEQLTLLSLAISLVAVNYGIRRRDLIRGVEKSFQNTVRATTNLSKARGIEQEH